MAWDIFYRPMQESSWYGTNVGDQHPPVFVREYSPHGPVTGIPDNRAWSQRHQPPHRPPHRSATPRPHFGMSLSETVLNDPAFSSDPRSHPHFPLTDARSFKELPAKPQRSNLNHNTAPIVTLHDPIPQKNTMYPLTRPPTTTERPPSPLASSVALEYESREPIFTIAPSTVSSSTLNSSSTMQTHGHYIQPSRLSPPNLRPPPYTKFPFNHDLHSSSVLAQSLDADPRLAPYAVSTSAVQSQVQPQPRHPALRENTDSDLTRSKKRSSGKGRIRNLVQRLTKRENLDRIDELDETDPFGLGFHHSGPYEAIRNLVKPAPASVPDSSDNLTKRMQNAEHEALPPTSALLPRHDHDDDHSAEGAPIPAKVDSTTNEDGVWTGPNSDVVYCGPTSRNTQSNSVNNEALSDQSNHPLELYPPVNRSSPSPPVPRVHCFGDVIPRIPSKTSYHTNPASAPYFPNGKQRPTHFPSNLPGYGSRTPSPERSPRLSPADAIIPPPQSERTVRRVANSRQPQPSLPPKKVPSSDGSRSPAAVHAPSSRDRPPRAQHLPKRLVMPTPLQQPQPSLPPQPHPQPRYAFPGTGGRTHSDHGALLGAGADETSATNRKRKMLRKKSTSMPTNVPFPVQLPNPRAGNGLSMDKGSPSAVMEGGKIQRGTRRRKLSKRKMDV